jgi:hypothetical protein
VLNLAKNPHNLYDYVGVLHFLTILSSAPLRHPPFPGTLRIAGTRIGNNTCVLVALTGFADADVFLLIQANRLFLFYVFKDD